MPYHALTIPSSHDHIIIIICRYGIYSIPYVTQWNAMFLINHQILYNKPNIMCDLLPQQCNTGIITPCACARG
jgi:hypothetical protein